MKVVEGQMGVWQMASDLSGISHSMASSLFRDFVSAQNQQQQLWPDVLPSVVKINQSIDEVTGKLISQVT